jgi:hypothetical protein
MATIHVARDGTNIGTFSTEEVQDGLRAGRFLPTDMGWEAGMPDWRPLSQMMAEKSAGTTLPVSVSSSPDSAVPQGGLPWEHREQLGILKAYIDTVSLVLTKPADAFVLMKKEQGDLMGPLLFALIGGSLGMIVSFLFQIGLQSIGLMGGGQNAISSVFGMGIGIVLFIFLVPVLMVVGMFIGSGILHLCLMILGGAKKSFETTFRVVCFASGSTYLLSMIPICGGLIASVWNIVLECIGLARAHEIETGKAVMAVLLPIIVCCGGMILIGVLGGFGALSLFNRH